MPQMSPIYWLVLLIYFIFILLMMMMLVYFFFFPLQSSKFIPISSNSLLIWKW